MSPSKDLGMLHLCCAIANACVKWSREWITNALHHAFLPCLWCRPGNESLCYRPSRMHMIITTCTSNVFCVRPSLSFSSLCKCISFCCEWKTMMMLFNLSQYCKWFSFKRPWSAVWGLEVWRLKAEDCLFKPLQDKHTRMCLQVILIWTAPVFTSVNMCSLTSSFMLYDVIIYHNVL